MSVLDTLVFDRTSADVQNRTAKGVYNAADMNRVSAAVAELREEFAAHGYGVSDSVLRVWSENELPRLSDAEAYLAAVRDLNGRFVYSDNMVVLPASMRFLTYDGANRIEKFLSLMPGAFERMRAAQYYAGDLFCGEV